MSKSILLTAEHDEFRAIARSLINRLMVKHAPRWEKDGRIPRPVWKELAANGVFRLPVTGSEVWRTSIFLQELGHLGYGGIRSAIGVAAFMAPYYIEKFGSEKLKAKYLSAIRKGDCIAALAISESGNGSDLRKISCIGELDGSVFLVINGKKDFIANGRQADIFVTLIKTEKSSPLTDLTVSSFVIVDNTPGCVHIEPIETMGWKSADICRVHFNRCYICLENIIGRPNMGMLQLVGALDFERLVAGTLALGGAQRTIKDLINTAMSGSTKGKPLGANQAISHTVANHACMLRMAETYCDAAWLCQGSEGIDTATATTLKLQTTELEMAVAQDLLRFKGANGFEANTDAARFHRDAIAGTIAAGPSELMRDIIFTEECTKRAKQRLSIAKPMVLPELVAVAGE